MLLPLLLALLWAGDLSPGADTAFTTRHKEKDPKSKLEVTDAMTVQEGLCVLLTCKVDIYYWTVPGYGYWFREGAGTDHDSPVATNNPARQVQKETHGWFPFFWNLQNKISYLSIRDTQRRDSGSYFFRVEAGSFKWNYCSNQVSVHVTGKPQAPSGPQGKVVEPTGQEWN
jgi:hypothetical protein